MGVTQIGYLGLNIENSQKMAEWRKIANDVLRCKVREDGPEGSMFFKIDERHHRIALHQSDRTDIAYIGWEVNTVRELEAIVQKLRDDGFEVRKGTDEEKALRRVKELYALKDPSGFPVELYFSAWVERDLPSNDGHLKFNAGHLGFGHVVAVAKDPHKLASFYMKYFDLKISDYNLWGEIDAVFMHCNPRHHSFAVCNEAYGMKEGEINHFMLEVASRDDVGRAFDVVESMGLTMLSLGRHANDGMFSFYFHTPSGFQIEYGADGLLIEDESKWTPSTYGAASQWGHIERDTNHP